MNTFSIGMIEFSNIASAMENVDVMSKAADVEPIFFKTICPGKYIAAVCGDVMAVIAAVDAGKSVTRDPVDSVVIPNIHQDVLTALSHERLKDLNQSLGIIETCSAASAILASDAAVKAAAVQLLDVRLPRGLGGKSYCLMAGDTAAVNVAVDTGAMLASESGQLVSKVVIPGPATMF